jgi:hypothetical protein
VVIADQQFWERNPYNRRLRHYNNNNNNNNNNNSILYLCERQQLVAYNRQALNLYIHTDPEVPGSIPGATKFSEKYWVWNGVHSAS